jgi:hypothetical protein
MPKPARPQLILNLVFGMEFIVLVVWIAPPGKPINHPLTKEVMFLMN